MEEGVSITPKTKKMKKDITSRLDIEKLVAGFYQKLRAEAMFAHYFVQIKDWDAHLTTIELFWENVIFYTGNYEGNPMELHQALHERLPLTKKHFNKWLALFNTEVDKQFIGKNATAIKQKAKNIAIVMQVKLFEKVTSA